MEKVEDKKENILTDIESMKKGSYEQMMLITVYSLSSYFRSLFAFGNKSDVTKDNLNVIKEMFRILKEERKLLNYILQHLSEFDIVAAEHVVEILDDLNDKTVEYYYEVIEEIEDAVDMGEERRGIRPRKNFPTLIQSNTYANEVIALTLNKKAIKEFLGYEEEFWQHIKEDNNSTLRTHHEGVVNMAYAIPITNTDGTVNRVRMYIPEIADLDGALLAIKTYQKAYQIYKSIGQVYDVSNFEVDEDVTTRFQDEYLAKQVQLKLK